MISNTPKIDIYLRAGKQKVGKETMFSQDFSSVAYSEGVKGRSST